MPESIGQGCNCLYAFDKSILEVALETMIREAEGVLEHHQGKSDAADLVSLTKQGLAMYKVVKERLSALPDCP